MHLLILTPILTKTTKNFFSAEKVKKNSGFTLYVQQFYGLLVKCMLHTFRHKLLTVVHLVAPVFFIILNIYNSKSTSFQITLSQLQIHPDIYGQNAVPFSNDDPSTRDLAMAFIRQFKSSNSLTTVVNVTTKELSLKNYTSTLGKSCLLLGQRKKIGFVFAVEFNYKDDDNRTMITAIFNGQKHHSTAIALASIFNGIYQYIIDDGRPSIVIYNHPLPGQQSENQVCHLDFYDMGLSRIECHHF